MPDTETMDEPRRRCDLYSVELLPRDQRFLDLLFEGGSGDGCPWRLAGCREEHQLLAEVDPRVFDLI